MSAEHLLPTTGIEVSAAAARGPLRMDVVGLSKQFRIKDGRTKVLLSAVDGVSFGLYQKAVVALVGESGSGKSTVARLLAGQERPSAGAIRFDGEPVSLRSRGQFLAYKDEVQMIFQDPFASLNPVHTVAYTLRRAVQLHREDLQREAVHAELVALLAQVGLVPPEQFLAKYPHELSGGQRQRVAIARGLAVRPRVLLADEPVSMLDVSIRLEVLRLLDDLRERYELAVLYITHDIASARYFADEILVMYAGQIVERGPAEEVTQRPGHPYTQLLVSSSPDPEALGSVLRRGSGAVARRSGSAVASSVGCRFSPRCPFAVDRCRAESPPPMTISRTRAAACWRIDAAAPGLLEDAGSATSSNG